MRICESKDKTQRQRTPRSSPSPMTAADPPRLPRPVRRAGVRSEPSAERSGQRSGDSSVECVSLGSRFRARAKTRGPYLLAGVRRVASIVSKSAVCSALIALSASALAGGSCRPVRASARAVPCCVRTKVLSCCAPDGERRSRCNTESTLPPHSPYNRLVYGFYSRLASMRPCRQPERCRLLLRTARCDSRSLGSRCTS